jgi:hypothetical protein
MWVKAADNFHNSMEHRINRLPEGERDIVNRYRRSMAILEKGIKEAGG